MTQNRSPGQSINPLKPQGRSSQIVSIRARANERNALTALGRTFALLEILENVRSRGPRGLPVDSHLNGSLYEDVGATESSAVV